MHVRVGDQAASVAARRRAADPDQGPRPVIACVGIAAALSAIVLGLTPPAGYSATPAWVHALIVIVGVAVLAIPAQLLYRLRRPEWASIDEAEVIAESEE